MLHAIIRGNPEAVTVRLPLMIVPAFLACYLSARFGIPGLLSFAQLAAFAVSAAALSHEFLYRQSRRGRRRRLATGYEPFSYKPIVEQLRGFGSVRTEVMTLAVEGDNRLRTAALYLSPILREGLRETWHVRFSGLRKTVWTVLRSSENSALPTVGR